MKRFLQCGLLLTIFCQGGGNAVYATKVRAMMPVSADGSVPEVPYTGTYQNGVLDTAPKYYDLRVTGSCDTSSTEKAKLEIKGFDEAPNFFKKVGTEIVFAEPSPMATVQLPSGYTAYVTVTLSAVTAHSSTFADTLKKYLALGIHLQGAEKGKYEDILYVPSTTDETQNNPSECFHMNDRNVLEFVPLVSSTALPTFTPVNDGDPLNKCSAITDALVETGFDFGSIFKVEAKCSDTAPGGKWVDQKWGYIYCGINNFIYVNDVFFAAHNVGSGVEMHVNKDRAQWECLEENLPGLGDAVLIGGLFYSQTFKRYISISWGGEGYVSEDGYKWIAEANFDIDDSVYGIVSTTISQKFIVMDKKGGIWSLMDGEQTWSDHIEPYENLTKLSEKCDYFERDGIRYLSYGSGVLVAATMNGWISVGTVDTNGNITDWSVPESTLQTILNQSDANTVLGLAFGEGKFLAISQNGDLASSTNGHNWASAGSTGVGKNICGLVYGGDAFYAMNDKVYRSPSPIDLTNK